MRKRIVGLFAALSLFVVLALPAGASHESTPMVLSAGSGTLSDGGRTATINVTFTCAFAGNYNVSATLRQISGRLQNSGGSGTYGSCLEGEKVTAPVTIRSTYDTGFKAGPAQLRADVELYSSALVCDDQGCYYANSGYGEMATTVKLQSKR